ncbi:peptidase family C78-domain-containing protein [Mycena epipterygia]|nr:peptidase family C78-domain-containing protein [Mycena epipterygia]
MSYTLSGGRMDQPKATSNVQCQLCDATLDHLSVIQREEHYDRHFNDEPKKQADDQPKASSSNNQPLAKASSSKAPPEPESSSKFSWKDWGHHKGQDRFWYPAQTSKPPPNFTPGLIPLLKTHLNKSHLAGNSRRAVLCYNQAVLVNREVWDAGWGCGYRNFLMACAALMAQPFQDMYFPRLDHPISPGVRNLQQWIEDAWKAGFDPEGARELKKLVGTRKWIGTSDIQVAFTSRGIPSKLVDFDLKANERGTDILTDWVVEYFSQPHGSVDSDCVLENRRPRTINDALLGASAITVTSRMPLILQHAGHSRTVVGYEVSKTGLINLLVFDPSRIPNKRLHQAGLDSLAVPPQHNPTDANAVASSSHKRPATSQFLTNPAPLKRSRLDNQKRDDADDDEVQIIHDSRDENISGRGKLASLGGKLASMRDKKKKKKDEDGDTMSTPDTLKFFRLDPKKLGKKKAYQVLYFPMSAPLNEFEIHAARGMNIYGEKIC